MKRNFIIILMILFLTGCADSTVAVECFNTHIYGFLGGLWHGIVLPFSFFGSLFSEDIAIYAVSNNGGWYDFVFVLGCGALTGTVTKSSSK